MINHTFAAWTHTVIRQRSLQWRKLLIVGRGHLIRPVAGVEPRRVMGRMALFAASRRLALPPSLTILTRHVGKEEIAHDC